MIFNTFYDFIYDGFYLSKLLLLPYSSQTSYVSLLQQLLFFLFLAPAFPHEGLPYWESFCSVVRGVAVLPIPRSSAVYPGQFSLGWISVPAFPLAVDYGASLHGRLVAFPHCTHSAFLFYHSVCVYECECMCASVRVGGKVTNIWWFLTCFWLTIAWWPEQTQSHKNRKGTRRKAAG